MKIKLKGICVDINKPRSEEALMLLRSVCKTEMGEASVTKKAFLIMIIEIIDNKVKKEYQLCSL